MDDTFRFESEPKSIDIVYLYSVFSHTIEEDMRIYLKDFSRILDDKGKLFLTTFVEEDVPDISINPENYRFKCSSPLHVVRYRKDYLFSIFEEYGYSVLNFTYETETNGQSAIYLIKKNKGDL
jgi:predicted SAM-dependent methyltransferase